MFPIYKVFRFKICVAWLIALAHDPLQALHLVPTHWHLLDEDGIA